MLYRMISKDPIQCKAASCVCHITSPGRKHTVLEHCNTALCFNDSKIAWTHLTWLHFPLNIIPKYTAA
jgi:hypothetical protein